MLHPQVLFGGVGDHDGGGVGDHDVGGVGDHEGAGGGRLAEGSREEEGRDHGVGHKGTGFNDHFGH